MKEFINAIGGTADKKDLINVTFCNGSTGTYTTAILELLKSDNSVVTIVSDYTGEILFERGI